jgi:NADPH:quinone reductase-like Zn-dependent oxidoreductase
MFFEGLSLTYHSPVTIESLTYGVSVGMLQGSSRCGHSRGSARQADIVRRERHVSDTKQGVAITGASSGIGEAAALLLAERGAKVVLGARASEKLRRWSTASWDRVATQPTHRRTLEIVRNETTNGGAVFTVVVPILPS